MEKKIYLKKILAVSLCLIFTWFAVCLWAFSYEIVERFHCVIEIPEMLAIVFGCLGMSCSCLAFGSNDGSDRQN